MILPPRRARPSATSAKQGHRRIAFGALLTACVALLIAAGQSAAADSTSSPSCWRPASEPVTATVTWSEAPATGACTYDFEYLSAFDWVLLSTPDWYYVYAPVNVNTDPTAFDYAGRAWTLMSSASNGPVCAAGSVCGGVDAPLGAPPGNCDELTDADWSALTDYLYITGVYAGDPDKLELLMACGGYE
jgi:hypothetical protein